MATISNIQGAVGTRLMPSQVSGKQATDVDRHAPVATPAVAEPPARPEIEPHLDIAATRELVDRLQETIDKVASEPHQVGFRADPRAKGYVIEIRDVDGSLVKQFPPEKLLNLRRKMAELSGMVVDETT